MDYGSYAPMAPMHLVEQIRALAIRRGGLASVGPRDRALPPAAVAAVVFTTPANNHVALFGLQPGLQGAAALPLCAAPLVRFNLRTRFAASTSETGMGCRFYCY